MAPSSSDVLLKITATKSKRYSFDKVFCPGSTQDEVFSEVEPVIKSVLVVYNACVFAYGQTGTGKTFTMEGTPDEPGVVPRIFETLFKQAVDSNHSFLISFSMLEIYMGNLRDLLVPKPARPTDPMPPCISVQTYPEGGIEIDNLLSVQVNDFHQALKLYRLGCRFRSTASTFSNITSSRSHCMIRITITCLAPERRRETNKVWLVDLGGSERVLKTKASGRRLHEGKAINLSLSALGDVLYALQRKKCHVPYRNSKLTQVLKDSLGNDSKVLMLVHVSPKEEDLCETICSLNFATRAKHIHLGNEDSIEVRKQKTVAMANLQQKMIEMENERLHARIEIEKLEKRVENLTGKSLSSNEQLETLNLTKDTAGGVAVASISKFPRYMTSTFCSRRKSGMICQTSKLKIPETGRKRRVSSHRSESVTFPIKDHSDNKSEYGISRSSCLLGLEARGSADSAAEYCQELSEIDVQIIDLRDQEKEPRSSDSHLLKKRNRQKGKKSCNKFLEVDNWLDLQENTSDHIQRTKRVLAPPTPEQNRGRNAEEESVLYDFETLKAVNHSKTDKLVTYGGVGRATPEVEVDKLLLSMQVSFTEDKRMIETQKIFDASLTENDTWNNFSSEDGSCHRFSEYKDDNRSNTLFITQAVEDYQNSDAVELHNHACGHILQSDSDARFSYSKGDNGDSMYVLELEQCSQKLDMEPIMKDSDNKDSEFYSQPLAKERRRCLPQVRAQKALFMSHANPKDSTQQADKPQGELETKGKCHVLVQKIETFWVSVLLGLGLYNLGYGHEFFYSLML